MGEKMSRKNDDWELEELDLEKELGEQDDDWEGTNDWPEESKPLKPGAMLLIFLGLAVLAAIICGILWNVTHRDKEEDGNVQYSAEVSEESAEPSFKETEPAAEPDSEGAAAPSFEGTGSVSETEGQGISGGSAKPEEPATEATPEPIPEPATEATPEPIPEPATEATPEPIPEPASEATPAPADTAGVNDANRVPTKDGRVIVFTDCDDTVSPKEYVNLRLEPSTSEGNSTVHCRLNYGETVHRTGISEDSGWSRVEIDGVTCYVVTSFIYVVE